MGNYSRNPQAALQQALDKGYTRVRFQQGKPILDRELNLLGDLSGAQELARHYVGNGVPADSDGFNIVNVDFANNDFTIKAGRCIVNGLDVVLAANTTYKNQPNKARVGPIPQASGFVYLRAFTTEVTDAQDTDLGNGGDIGFETALREKVDWEVLVSQAAVNQPDHFLLAEFTNFQGGKHFMGDRRVTGVTLARLREDLSNTTGSASGISARLDNIMTGNALKDGVVTNSKIDNDAVTNSKLAGDSVGTNELQDNAVTGAKLADDSVTNSKLADDSVGPNEIQDNAVSTAQLVNGSVTADKLAGWSVATGHLQDGAVISPKLAGWSVGTGHLQDGAVTGSKLGLVTKISGTVRLGPTQTLDILVEENVSGAKVTPYFPMVALAWSFVVLTGNSEVTANMVYKQNSLATVYNVYLRLNNSSVTALVDVLYRVDTFQ
ncbi:MAG TPA: hypothetical protein VF736_19180 [Pyrinomonadaceae bacterium]|jgi:hypothetical protein